MPKTTLQRFSISRLSVLGEQGELDPKYASTINALPDEFLKKIFQQMWLTRLFDEKATLAQRQGRLGTFAASMGQEAIQIGSAAALETSDWVVPCFREQGIYLWRGIPAKTLFQFFMGSEWGNVFPKEKHILPYCVPCASQTLHAVGLAMAAKLKGDPICVVTYLGDGATSEGDFHEALNLASVNQAPVVFICQNNHWAISTSRQKQYHGKTLAQRAMGYGMEGLQVDGNDVLAVHQATQQAASRAKRGLGPSFLECETYRLCPHTTNDNPDLYQDKDELKVWQAKDPLIRFEKFLSERALLKAGEKENLIQWLNRQLKAQLESAEQEMKKIKPQDMLNYVYKENTPQLKEQREALRQRLNPTLTPTPKQEEPQESFTQTPPLTAQEVPSWKG